MNEVTRLMPITGQPDDDGASTILEAIRLGHVRDDSGEAEDG